MSPGVRARAPCPVAIRCRLTWFPGISFASAMGVRSGTPVFTASCYRLARLPVGCSVLLFEDADTWDVDYLAVLFLRFLASGRASGKTTFSCSDELSNFGLRAACFII